MLSPKTISRASVINFLDALVGGGMLVCTETMGKGGHRRIYRMKYDEAGFKEHIARVVVRKLLRDFPEEFGRDLEGLSEGP